MDTRAPMLWDIFCKVIDNYGDIGVCWRLAADLASRGARVRLWLDDAAPLAWMAPGGHPNVHVRPWTDATEAVAPGAVVIEAFGCELPTAFQAAIARRARARGQPSWINLEYLTAEPYAERSHGLPSPVMTGPAAGLTKHFFYPGFTPRTGGLLREPGLSRRQAAFDRAAWLRGLGIPFAGERLVSLFCYEPAALDEWLARLALGPQPTRLLVTPGRATAAVQSLLGEAPRAGALLVHWLPTLPQTGFDELLWACDLNFVRGEDSLVRALWAGKPLVWQAYPQNDDAHHAKLEAFLQATAAPTSLREFHRAWNGLEGAALPRADLAGWGAAALAAREALLAQDDLAAQLIRFVEKTA